MAKKPNGESVIRIEGMHKWFGNFHALKDIDLEVAQGEKIVICGPSGSGKSTLIRCINRLESHENGSILVDGVELTEDSKKIAGIRSEVGMVFQQYNPTGLGPEPMPRLVWSARRCCATTRKRSFAPPFPVSGQRESSSEAPSTSG